LTVSARGNSLLVTMIALSVMMVLVIGAISFTGTNRQAAVGKVRGDRITACADTARRYLLSKLRVYGVSVTDLKLSGSCTYARIPDAPNTADQSLIGPGHYGDDLTAAAPAVAIVSGSAFGEGARQIRDMANAAPGSSTLGGQYYRVVMKCQEPGAAGVARESEVEFVFRYGL
jgi:hypothetical protein